MGKNKKLFMDLREEEFFRDKMYIETQQDILFRELLNEDYDGKRSEEYNNPNGKSDTKKNKTR